MRYQKKPVVIDAWRTEQQQQHKVVLLGFSDDPDEEAQAQFDAESGMWMVYDYLHDTYVKFEPGDWIIRGLKGEFYPCKPDIFEASYEPVQEG